MKRMFVVAALGVVGVLANADVPSGEGGHSDFGAGVVNNDEAGLRVAGLGYTFQNDELNSKQGSLSRSGENNEDGLQGIGATVHPGSRLFTQPGHKAVEISDAPFPWPQAKAVVRF